MHPFLRSPKNLFRLVIVWIPVCLAVILLNVFTTNQPWLESTIIIFPAMVVEFFFLISTWYICKSISLEQSNILIALLKHGLSLAAMVAGWLLLIKWYSLGLDRILKAQKWHFQFSEMLPILAMVGFFLYFLSCLIHYLVLAIEKAQKAEQLMIEQKYLASQSELKSLKTTIHPHFLFNSLTALSSLTRSDPERAQEVCLQLSDFFRYNLRYTKKDKVTVQEELDHIENYLNIEKTRLGQRLKTDLKIDPKARSVHVLPLTLLPLVENAVKHGIQQCVEGGTVSLSIQKGKDQIYIQVSNPIEPLSRPQKGEGFGLNTLKRRISTHYGNQAHLAFAKVGKTFTVSLTIPHIS